MDKKTIKKYIGNLNEIKSFLEEFLKNPDGVDFSSDINEENRLKEFTELRMMTKSNRWPEAVPGDFICENKEEEKLQRAQGIIFDFELPENLNFLDFGCGEGHVAFLKSLNSKKSIGFDLKDQNWSHFEKKENLIFSTNWDEIEKNGPYDIILCNDVLDHAKDPLEELKKIQKVKTPEIGKIFVRIHPWTSRHGSHLYKELNKAYLQLVFSEDELFVMGIEQEKINKTLDPAKYYKDLFKQVGFTVLKEEAIDEIAEDIFSYDGPIRKRIQSNWPEETRYEDIIKIIEIQFLDFTLI